MVVKFSPATVVQQLVKVYEDVILIGEVKNERNCTRVAYRN